MGECVVREREEVLLPLLPPKHTHHTEEATHLRTGTAWGQALQRVRACSVLVPQGAESAKARKPLPALARPHQLERLGVGDGALLLLLCLRLRLRLLARLRAHKARSSFKVSCTSPTRFSAAPRHASARSPSSRHWAAPPAAAPVALRCSRATGGEDCGARCAQGPRRGERGGALPVRAQHEPLHLPHARWCRCAPARCCSRCGEARLRQGREAWALRRALCCTPSAAAAITIDSMRTTHAPLPCSPSCLASRLRTSARREQGNGRSFELKSRAEGRTGAAPVEAAESTPERATRPAPARRLLDTGCGQSPAGSGPRCWAAWACQRCRAAPPPPPWLPR